LIITDLQTFVKQTEIFGVCICIDAQVFEIFSSHWHPWLKFCMHL